MSPPGKVGITSSASKGSITPGALHNSQCVPLGCAERPSAAAVSVLLLATRLLKLQTPPSLPLCTSCANMNTGANNANMGSEDDSDFTAFAPDGTTLRGWTGAAVKNGTLAAGNGVYGEGNVCLFTGVIFSG